MIYRLKVENFYSINNVQEIDFTSKKTFNNGSTKIDDKYISNVNCFVGANASGKTNFLKAITFAMWFAEKSFYKINENSEQEMFFPHKLQSKKPTKCELIFDSNSNLYRYKFELTRHKLLNETLEVKSEKGFAYLYKLSNNDKGMEIKYNRNNKMLPPINKKEEQRFKNKAKGSFLSFLMGTGYLDDIKLSNIATKVFSNVFLLGSRSLDSNSEAIILSKALEKSADLKKNLLPYLKSFDFGIENYAKDGTYKVEFSNGANINLIGFKHSNNKQSFTVSAFEESSGTIKGTYLLLKLLEVLSKGGIAIIDELDARLHFDIAKYLISLFANKETNKSNAQLFFSTHQPLFLNDRDKKQIFLCYKEDCLNSEIYRLDEVEGVRNTENFFEKYLSGEYGATPRIGKC